MQEIKISDLAVVTALVGTDTIPVVQSGVTKSVTAQKIADLFVVPSGATGTFQSGDLVPKTITVVNGRITTIV